MFITLVIVLAAVFAAITGLESRRRGGGIPVRDKSVPRAGLLAGSTQPRQLPDDQPPEPGGSAPASQGEAVRPG